MGGASWGLARLERCRHRWVQGRPVPALALSRLTPNDTREPATGTSVDGTLMPQTACAADMQTSMQRAALVAPSRPRRTARPRR